MITSPVTVVPDISRWVAASTIRWPLGKETKSWCVPTTVMLHPAQVAVDRAELRSAAAICQITAPLRSTSCITEFRPSMVPALKLMRKCPFGSSFTALGAVPLGTAL